MSKHKTYRWDGKSVSRREFYKNYKTNYGRPYVAIAENDNQDSDWLITQEICKEIDQIIMERLIELDKKR